MEGRSEIEGGGGSLIRMMQCIFNHASQLNWEVFFQHLFLNTSTKTKHLSHFSIDQLPCLSYAMMGNDDKNDDIMKKKKKTKI